MPIRICPVCSRALSFESRHCEGCLRALGFAWWDDAFLALDDGQAGWIDASGQRHDLIPCGNATFGVCNWLVSSGAGDDRCIACRLNRTIPDLTITGVLDRWRRIEDAKRRMLHGVLKLGLSITAHGRAPPITFDFLYDPAAERGGAPQFTTGHAFGVITLNVIEADDAARERIRQSLNEPYRTLLGHFRHEIAHYYWQRLVDGSPDQGPFRKLFGDERENYGAALQRYYEAGAPPNWQEHYISAYASTHPWEDFAETFAHYLYIVDTLATIHEARLGHVGGVEVATLDPYTASFAEVGSAWVHMAFKLNEISRSMGHRDLYPFSLSPGVMLKLDFVHRLVAFSAGRWAPGSAEGAELQAMISALRTD